MARSPEWSELVKKFRVEIPGFDRRHAVTPGLTGIAQIYGHSESHRRQKLRYDLVYIKKQSFWLDLRIVFISFLVTFTGKMGRPFGETCPHLLGGRPESKEASGRRPNLLLKCRCAELSRTLGLGSGELGVAVAAGNRQFETHMEVQPLTEQVGLPPRTEVLGAPVYIVDVENVLRLMEQWIGQRDRPHWIAVTGSHGALEAHKRPDFRAVLQTADLSVPDGRWAARVAARKMSCATHQVRGADLMSAFCELSSKKGFTNYFYGDTDETLSLARDAA